MFYDDYIHESANIKPEWWKTVLYDTHVALYVDYM